MDDELFDKFGLPKELMVGDSIAKESQRITVKVIKKKFNKKYTTVQGIDAKSLDIKEIARKLKEKFACGGTFKDNIIELQGDHLARMRKALIELDFPPEVIDVIQSN
ncbi:MAG TPA: stress response translation initiation inhibitor YciH [Acidobacteriota bacterium]|nr:stress response translation initiation inhibitor YciH [Acidobacteriota bacterium]